MNDTLLSIAQALQLVALAPCIFVIIFLMCTARKSADNVVPILYFLSLSCSFLLPLAEIFGIEARNQKILGTLMLGETMAVPLSFLLILQFLLGRIPPAQYWLILALPLFGGSPFIYASLTASEVCLGHDACYPTTGLRILYGVFSTALVFLLLIVRLSRSSANIAMDDIDRQHKYWLIIALIGLNLLQTLFDLGVLGGYVAQDKALIIATAIRIAFIYLVLTSIFRVFYELFDINLSPAGAEEVASVRRHHELDQERVDTLKNLLERDKIYREMGLTRAGIADKLGISEHQASRIINAYFHKNFNELINSYRVNEAKERLSKEDTAVTVIAFEVGFNSIASFNRVFKELVGSAPTEFRNFQKNSVR